MRIGLYQKHRFHSALFRRLLALLQPVASCRLTDDLFDLRAFRPHVVLSGENLLDDCVRDYMPAALYVHVRHGLACKGVPARSFAVSDYTCVSSVYLRDHFVSKGVRPRRGFWPIGYLQMDNLAEAPPPPELAQARGKPVVLYAPTFQPGLSSIPMLGDDPVRALLGDRDDRFLVVKPHPLVAKRHPAAWARLRESARRANAFLVEDPDADLMSFLPHADLMVSDASSAFLEFLAFDRPLVLVTNPARSSDAFYDPKGFEWQWRDAGEEVERVEELPAAIERGLADPGRRSERRRLFRERLFGDTLDGQIAERLVAHLLALRPEVASERRLAAAHLCSSLLLGLGRARSLPRRCLKKLSFLPLRTSPA